MAENSFLADVPEEILDEVSILYKLGVNIDDIEYIINNKAKNSAA